MISSFCCWCRKLFSISKNVFLFFKSSLQELLTQHLSFLLGWTVSKILQLQLISAGRWWGNQEEGELMRAVVDNLNISDALESEALCPWITLNATQHTPNIASNPRPWIISLPTIHSPESCWLATSLIQHLRICFNVHHQ